MGGDERVPDDEASLQESKTPRVFSPGRIVIGAAIGGGVCGLTAVAVGGAASCAITKGPVDYRELAARGSATWAKKSKAGAAPILAVPGAAERQALRGVGRTWRDKTKPPTRQRWASGSPLNRFPSLP